MPLYEYKCDRCKQVFEVMQKFSDEPLRFHAGCGGAVERLISSPAIQFKGSGWYVTDYARKGGSQGASKSNGAEPASGEAAATKTAESKPAETTAPASKPPESK